MSVKRYCIASLGWILLSLLFFTFYCNLSFLFVGLLLLYVGLFAFAVGWVAFGIQRWRASHQATFLLAALPVLTLGAYLWHSGFSLGHQLYFMIQKPHFQRVVRELKSGTKTQSIVNPLLTCDVRVESDLELRIAFIQGGILDNFGAVIYDESDELATLAEFKASTHDSSQSSSKIRHLLKIFGGDVISCQRLQKHWYYCSFT
jgi:hypothetical protein